MSPASSVSVAVETEKGLVVPVVRHADRLSLAGLAAAIDDLASRAGNRRLSADDLQGGTFTVTALGMTRFSMRMAEAVALVEYAAGKMHGGEGNCP